MMGSNREYEKLELLLKQTQEEVGHALLSLQYRQKSKSAHNTDPTRAPSVSSAQHLNHHRNNSFHGNRFHRRETGHHENELRHRNDVINQHRDDTRNGFAVQRNSGISTQFNNGNNNTRCHGYAVEETLDNSSAQLQQAVDFLSIFAADNLTPDQSAYDPELTAAPPASWAKTLPSSFRKKPAPERPRTLTPPPQPDRKRFRKRDWKFYVHGKYKTHIPVQQKQEYGLEPIQTDNTYIKYGVFKQVLSKDTSSHKRKSARKVSHRQNVVTDTIVCSDSVNSHTCDNTVDTSKDKSLLLHEPTLREVLDNTANPSSIRQVSPPALPVLNSSDLENSNIEIHLEPLHNILTSSAFKQVQNNAPANIFRPVVHSNQNLTRIVPELDPNLRHLSLPNPRAFPESIGTVSSISLNSFLSELVTGSSTRHDSSSSSTDVASLADEGIDMEAEVVKATNNSVSGNGGVVVGNGVVRQPVRIGTNIPGPHVVKPKPKGPNHAPGFAQALNHVTSNGGNNNSVTHEGTMTSLTSESSASDGYHRESSMSPNTPEYRSGKGARASDKPGSNSQPSYSHKSAERRYKKSRSKSRDKPKREGSPSRTERASNGKISCATQTAKSVKNCKYGAKGEPPSVLPSSPVRHQGSPIRHPASPSRRGTSPVKHPTMPNRHPTSPDRQPTSPLREPSKSNHRNSPEKNGAKTEKKAGNVPPKYTESSTSSDECGDVYKKVNMPALRERVLQNRERSKHEALHSPKKSPDSDTCIEINIVDGQMSVEEIQASERPRHLLESEDDILETDMYSMVDDGDVTPVPPEMDQCACLMTSQRCDSCQLEQARQAHLDEQLDTVPLYNTASYSHTASPSSSMNAGSASYIQYMHDSKTPVNAQDISCLNLRSSEGHPFQTYPANMPNSYMYDDSDRSSPVWQKRVPAPGEFIPNEENSYPYDGVNIPPREQRRIRTKPMMPIIVEDRSRSSTSTNAESNPSATSSLDRNSLNRRMQHSPHKSHDSNQRSPYNTLTVSSHSPGKNHSVPPSPGGYSSNSLRSMSSNASSDMDGDAENQSKPVSLLDRLHKKAYPSHYTCKPPDTDPEKVRVMLSPVTSHRPLNLQKHEPPICLKTGKPVVDTTKDLNSPSKVVADTDISKDGSNSLPNNYGGNGRNISPVKSSEVNTQLKANVTSQSKSPPHMLPIATTKAPSSLPSPQKSSPTKDNIAVLKETNALTTHSVQPRQQHREDSNPRPTKISTSSFSSSARSCDNSPESPEYGFEIEAIEACKWLRAAGFPQYAQMYEDQQFPVDISSVQRDHDFLDKDSIQSLFRRLNTLNKCAVMKIEAPPRKTNEDSDEDEQCALSDKWKYTRSSRRWSRKDLDLSQLSPDQKQALQGGGGSQDSLLSDNKDANANHCIDVNNGPPSLNCDVTADDAANEPAVAQQVEIHINDRPKVNFFDNRDRSKAKINNNGVFSGSPDTNDSSPTLRRVSSEKLQGAKSFFKRIESFKSKKSKKQKILYPPGTKLEIGEPVVQNSEDMRERMNKLGCRDISPQTSVSLSSPDTTPTTRGEGGKVLLTVDIQSDVISDVITESSLDMSPGFTMTGATRGTDNMSANFSSDDAKISTSDESLSATRAYNKLQNDNKNELENSGEVLNTNTTASSELEQIIFTLGSPDTGVFDLHNSPKVIANGNIGLNDGSLINCRTGSFNSGSQELATGRVTPRNIRASSEEAPPIRMRKHYTPKPQCRLSVYDNIQIADNVDPQAELDKILADLMENISGLDQSLDQTGSVTSLTLPTSELSGQGVTPHTGSSVGHQEPLAKLLKECNVHTSQSHSQTTTHSSNQSSHFHSTKPETTTTANTTTATKSGENTSTLFASQSKPMVDSVQPPEANVNNKNCDVICGGCGGRDGVKPGCAPPGEHCDNHVMIDRGMEEEETNIPSTSRAPRVPPLHHADADSPLDEEEGEEDARSSASSASHHDDDVTDDDEGETAGSRDDDSSDQPEVRERRDSGVGQSLTRAPSDRRRHRIRWHSFVKSHRPSLNSENLQIASMSAGQLMVLRKLCLLKVTALMEKYSPSNRSGWNWAVPKFMKRFKAPDYKDKHVFGVPLLVTLQRTGQPLPQCLLYAMRCLRRTAMDAVGIFRKSGVRSRIQKLRDQVEADPGQQHSVDFESLQPYDVADLIKQYFRELPECLLTNKLSETFISIFTYVPPEERVEALQCTCMLLPDENREVLQSLLLFLSDMASHSHQNQMTASNLAVCFAPSLFHMFGHNPSASPKRGRKSAGVPDEKELQTQKAAHECLTAMITEGKRLFMVPEDLLSKCRFSYMEQGDAVPLEELGKKRSSEDITGDHTGYLESCIQGLLKESRDKFKGWVNVSSHLPHIDLAYKKVGDGHPLRLWKCCVDVEAPPEEVLNRVLRERHLWDVDLLEWRVIEKLDAQTEVFQSIVNSMAPHPSRDFIELRSWRTQLPRGACVLVSTSVEHRMGALKGGIRAVILASRYLIEPCGAGKSRLTHICRIDIRGHTPEWYNKGYGHICANYIGRIRDSFKQTLAETDGPETKI